MDEWSTLEVRLRCVRSLMQFPVIEYTLHVFPTEERRVIRHHVASRIYFVADSRRRTGRSARCALVAAEVCSALPDEEVMRRNSHQENSPIFPPLLPPFFQGLGLATAQLRSLARRGSFSRDDGVSIQFCNFCQASDSLHALILSSIVHSSTNPLS